MNIVAPTAALDAAADAGGQSQAWPEHVDDRHSNEARANEARAGAAPRGALAAAALAGAAASAIVAAALVTLLPPRRVDDPRAMAMSRDVEDLKAQALAMAARLEQLDTGAVAAAEPVKAMGATLRAQMASLETVRRDLDALAAASLRSAEDQARLATPALLGVAVVQLRAAIERGGPFDWELVNLWGIAGRRPEAAAELNRLAGLAGGVPTQRQATAALARLAAGETATQTVADTAAQTIRWLLNAPAGASASGALAGAYAEAQALAERGDDAGAARRLRATLPPPGGAAEAALRDLDRRATALAASGRLMELARDGMSGQARAVSQAQAQP